MIGKTISHYKILDKLGEGGMGVVYKAEDLKLKRTVALKFLPPDLTRDPEAKERFIQEARAASALDHPNICVIHEIDETEDGQLFICMAYYEGETLKKKIEQEPLKTDESIDIATQVASGLSKAHEHGIVHRDIKPANIIITTDGIAKILDFGLAKLAGQVGLTKVGTTVGTIAYMSPEQARGEEVDERTDIWSLGVVLYEMITGQLPFRGEYEQAVVYSIMNEEPESITDLVIELPIELEQIVNKSLAKNKDERYKNTENLLEDLTMILKSLESGVPIKPIHRRKIALNWRNAKVLIPAISLVMFIILGLASLVFRGRDTKLNPNRIVVAIFENQTGDASLDPLGRMAADWTSQGLSQISGTEVVPMVAVLRAFDQAETQSITLSGMGRINALANETDARLVASGSYYLQGNILQFQAQITDASKGELIHSLEPVSGPRDSAMEVIESLREKFMSTMAAYIDPQIPIKQSSKPPDYQAYKEYFAGLSYFLKDHNKASYHFARSAALDSNFMFPRFYLLTLYHFMNQYAKADSLIKIINRHRDQLTPFEHFAVDGLAALIWSYRRETVQNRVKALDSFRQAKKLDPKNPVVNHTLGVVALMLNRPQETIDAYSDMNHADLPRELGKFWVMFFTEALHMVGNYEKELEEARRGRKYYGDQLLLFVSEARALAALGRVQEIEDLFNESLDLSDWFWEPGDIMYNASRELREHGYKQVAQEFMNRAIDWYKSAGNRKWLPRALYRAERWDEALILFGELHKEFPENVDFLGFLGRLAARRGDKKEALRISEQLRQIDWSYSPMHIYHRSCIAAVLGEHERAIELLQEAFAQGLQHRYWKFHEEDFEPLRDYAAFQKLLRPKG